MRHDNVVLSRTVSAAAAVTTSHSSSTGSNAMPTASSLPVTAAMVSSSTAALSSLSPSSSSARSKVLAAVAYALASTLIMVVNKAVLTGYAFPSFLFIAALQYLTSIIILLIQRWRGTVPRFPLLSIHVIRKVMPVPLLFLGNTVSGLGATKKLNMPLFVLLRRFSIVMTLLLEMRLLRRSFSRGVHCAVGLMVLGALISASGELTFDISGYVMILLNDLFTALQGVGLKRQLDELSHTGLGTAGIMYYNNLISLPLIALFLVGRVDDMRGLYHFSGWHQFGFIVCLCGTGVMGFVLNSAYYWCTKANSPLTTTVIGALKNIVTSYVGMTFGDYHYSHVGFLGVNVSVLGSLLYNREEWAKIRRQGRAEVACAAAVAVEEDARQDLEAETGAESAGAADFASGTRMMREVNGWTGLASAFKGGSSGNPGGVAIDVCSPTGKAAARGIIAARFPPPPTALLTNTSRKHSTNDVSATAAAQVHNGGDGVGSLMRDEGATAAAPATTEYRTLEASNECLEAAGGGGVVEHPPMIHHHRRQSSQSYYV